MEKSWKFVGKNVYEPCKYPTLFLRDASATLIHVPRENAQNIHTFCVNGFVLS